MELYQLRYFAKAAKYESVSKAAAELHVSQPALSKAISKLELEMGTDLFDRTGKRFVLTGYGRYFQRRVDQVIRDLEDGVEATKRMAEEIRETVNVGVFGPQRPALQCIDGFLRMNPAVQVNIRSKQQFRNEPILNEFDAVFYPAGSSFDSLGGQPYMRASMKIIVGPEHRLADRETVTMEELHDEQFIMLESTSGIQDRCYKLCEEAGFYPNVSAVVTSRVAQAYLVEAGHGIGMTDGMIDADSVKEYRTIRLESNEPEQELYVAFRPASGLSPAGFRFVEFARRFYGLN